MQCRIWVRSGSATRSSCSWRRQRKEREEEQASEKFWGAAALKNLSLKKKALPKKKEVKVEMKRSRGEIVGAAFVAAFVVVVAVFPTAVSVSATAAERGAEGRRREERQS